MSRLLEEIDKLYARLPKLECAGKCQECCGPIAMSEPEWKRIVKRVGFEPQGQQDLTCPLLTAKGKCSVYHIRPLVCRLWGIVESMRCPFGCKPEKYLTLSESYTFMDDMEKIIREFGDASDLPDSPPRLTL